MARVRKHYRVSRKGKRYKVRSHHRTPPWVNAFLFWVGLIVIAAMVYRVNSGK